MTDRRDYPSRAVIRSSWQVVGQRLTSARVEKNLSPEEVAHALLLSKRQVLGLEEADPAAFYSPAYYRAALVKYMAFAGVPASLLADDEDDERAGLRMTLDGPPSRRQSVHAGVSMSRELVAGVAVAVLGVTLGGFYLTRPARLTASASAPLESTPKTVLAEERPVVPSLSPASLIQSPDPAPAADSTIRITVGRPTWVYVRYPDNTVTERRLTAGQEMVVGPLPVFLAVGTTEQVELRVEDRTVPLDRFMRNGQIRMSRPELAALAVPAKQ